MRNASFKNILILIKGAGDLASGAAYRLKRSGFALMMIELPAPLLVRRTVCYGEAVYRGEVTVDGLVARRVDTFTEAHALATSDIIPVLVDPQASAVARLKPQVVVDAIMAKVNTGTTIHDAPLVIALGPGFTAGQDCHAVIETNRGHWLGRVIYPDGVPTGNGRAEPDTQMPSLIKGHTADRVLHAPAAGQVTPHAYIGDRIAAGQLIATVNGHEIRASFSGVLRGLVHSGVPVTPGLKIGDLDPRGEVSHCFTISDKSLAVGGGVLEAILASDLMGENNGTMAEMIPVKGIAEGASFRAAALSLAPSALEWKPPPDQRVRASDHHRRVNPQPMKFSYALNVNPGEVIALVGAGGKTTAMFLLASELAPRMRVLTTTGTRIFAAQSRHSPVHVTFNPEQQAVAGILSQLDRTIATHGQALLTGPADPDSDKILGLSPDIIDALARSGHFDIIINEADGSRMRSLKAPAAHEPVIPDCTTLVVPIAGLDVLAQPLGDDTVHRTELISRLTGTAIGQPVTADTVAAVLCHSEGGLKNVPAQARVVPLLNRVDEKEDGLKVARDIADKLLHCDRVDSVVIGAMREAGAPVAEVHSRVAAVILAAGGSTRFGSPKQLARWRDKTFIEQAVDTALASSARPVVVVLGAEAERCRAALGNRPVEVVINKAWAQGQSTSMQAGLAALPANIGAVVFFLVDLPGITPELIDRLLQRHRETLAPLVWPEFEGRRGNPILFDRSLFPELRRVSGDTGGKPVLLRHKDRAERVTVSDRGVLQDFDRAEDLALEMDQKAG